MASWQEGRQGTGYRKLLLLQGSFFDFYLLHFSKGSYIDWHTDPVSGKRHYRINVFLWNASAGGQVEFEKEPCCHNRVFAWFRPDINKHRVTRIRKGERYVLSFGWVM